MFNAGFDEVAKAVMVFWCKSYSQNHTVSAVAGVSVSLILDSVMMVSVTVVSVVLVSSTTVSIPDSGKCASSGTLVFSSLARLLSLFTGLVELVGEIESI